MIQLKSDWEMPLMRAAGRLLAEVIEEVRPLVKAGVTTIELDEFCEAEIRKRKARPAFKGYKVGNVVFPRTICASRNEAVVHGIPDAKPLKDGELISLDFGLEYGGYFADSAFSVFVGEPPPRVKELLDVTEESLYKAVSCAVPGAQVGDIGHTIQTMCEARGLGVVRDMVGHGIGRRLHEEPSVPNYGKAGTGPRLKPGMCLAIEPMITLGTWEIKTLADGWTVVTTDGSLAAHFEHTVLITHKGPEILTRLTR